MKVISSACKLVILSLVAYFTIMTQVLQSANKDVWPMQAPATSVAIVPAVSVSLSSSELQLLTTYATKVQRWGWRWRLSDNTTVLLTHLGSVLAATMNAFDLQASLCSCKVVWLWLSDLFDWCWWPAIGISQHVKQV